LPAQRRRLPTKIDFYDYQPSRSCDLAGAVLIFQRGELMKPPLPANDNIRPDKLLRYCDLNGTRGISYTRRHLYTLENEKKFPKRVPLGEDRVGWLESEIDEWIRGRAALRVICAP
jgi:prophage regulatory protein